MKLRIAKQSLRFRLNPEDLDQLREQKKLLETLSITGRTQWCYQISLSSVPETQVSALATELQIRVPEDKFLQWLQGKDLVWNFQQAEPALQISIEKDLKPKRI